MKKIDAKTVKQSISPVDFYSHELPGMPAPKRARWNNAGLCPFHDDHRPNSFFVNVDTGTFKCFSCGAGGGDIISFVRFRHGLSFGEALRKLADEWVY